MTDHNLIIKAARSNSSYTMAHCTGCNWRTYGPVSEGTARWLFTLAHQPDEDES